MRLHYDANADALYFRFDDSKIVESEEMKPGIIFDLNDRNQVVGLEVLGLKSRGIDLDSLKELTFKASS
jgi:uncharacterized protein YuzE